MPERRTCTDAAEDAVVVLDAEPDTFLTTVNAEDALPVEDEEPERLDVLVRVLEPVAVAVD